MHEVDVDQVWHAEIGEGPVIATAIHDGHTARPEVERLFELPEQIRLLEEDPFTGEWTSFAPTRVIGLRTRFQVDLNRPPEGAVYQRPEDCWGLKVWKEPLPQDVLARSMAEHRLFYDSMRQLFVEQGRKYGPFVVYDLHTYNHRRGGPGSPPADPQENPQVNVGTGSVDHARWGGVVQRLMDELRKIEFPGGKLDVRENVKFQGGHWPRWINGNFAEMGVAIALEFKKFFMDEWSGVPNRQLVQAIGDALSSTVAGVVEELQRV